MDSLAPGQRLGRYELVCPVGQGGMATVWLARLVGSRGFNKPVAIKVMLPSIREDADAERMFQNEAALASRIRHPNVVEILDFGEDSGVLYLVMEWVHGEPLSQVVNAAARQRGMPLGIAVTIVSQVLAGLHAAHELVGDDGQPLGLVHRDVSPQNVLVGFNGVVTLVDFGIAKVTAEAGQLTQGGVLKGKIAYMAPEQIRLQSLDRRTDVFAAGILLYLLTTGRHPFKREEIGKTALAIASSAPAFRPSKAIAEYPERLEQVVMKAIAKAPEERFGSSREFAEALLGAMPPSHAPAAEEVQRYLAQLLPERLAHHHELIRKALGVPGASGRAPHSLFKTAHSSSTLRAVSVSDASDSGAPAPEVQPPGEPTRHSQRPAAESPPVRQKTALLGIAAAAAIGAAALAALFAPNASVELPTPAAASPPVRLPSDVATTLPPKQEAQTANAVDGGARAEPATAEVAPSTPAPESALAPARIPRRTARPVPPPAAKKPAPASAMGLKDPYDD